MRLRSYGARLAMAHWLLLVVAMIAVLAAVPAQCAAQSTWLGRNLFSAVDIAWERLERHNPALYRLDDTDAKSWFWHGAITEVGGRAIGKFTPASTRTSLRIMAAFYVAREAYGVAFEKNRKYGDATMDAAVPVAVALFRVRVVLR